MPEGLFPEVPEDISALSDAELDDLLREHERTAQLIDQEDEEFIKGMTAEDVLAAYEAGVEQIEAIVAEQKAREDAAAEYEAQKAALAERRRASLAAMAEAEAEEAEEGDDDEGDGDEEEEEELAVEEVEEPEVEEVEVEATLAARPAVRRQGMRRPPQPRAERLPTSESAAMLVAAAGLAGLRGGKTLDRTSLADAMKAVASSVGAPTKSVNGIQQRFLVAQAAFPFPPERKLVPGEAGLNAEKIRQVIPAGIPGVNGSQALTASGGLCAPLEPIYSMPNFAVQTRPVRDALPSFQAERGGVNVPTATVIGDIDTAISVIEESEDALGGTFATKSCQDLECPDYAEVAVTVIAHCREYGNLNARAWPEKIAHENDLTMAAHARTAEQYLLDRIKALSLNVTAAAALGAMADLVDAIVRAAAAVRYRLRMSPDARFRVLMPVWVPDLLAADTIKTQFDRFLVQEQLASQLERYGISISFYLDTPSTGTSQGFAAEVDGSALDSFPAAVQWALYPEGAFIHVDAGNLDLGLVRDSTLNSTNDFQLFGETFENVARLAPAQAALWITSTVNPSGEVAAPA